MKYISHSSEDTFSIGFSFGQSLKGGECVTLNGDLGAGKTVFAKGVGKALGVKEIITSPTFTIICEYEGRLKFNHIDLYRVQGNFEEFCIPELYSDDAVTLIEWAAYAPEIIPNNAINVTIQVIDEGKREIEIS